MDQSQRIGFGYSSDDRADRGRLRLLNGFQLLAGDAPVDLPFAAQRVLALLAVEGRPSHRLHLAGRLWPDVEEIRAAANLRSALWRIRRSFPSAVDATRSHVRLAMDISVDLHVASRFARDLEDGARPGELVPDAWAPLTAELLPDWYDDWVVSARERFHQLRLHALEAVSRSFANEGRFGAAVEAAQLAVAGDSLRESAHRALIFAYLAEGNQGAAIAQFEHYRRLLQKELAVDPSPKLQNLVRGSGGPARA